ncbi:chitin deacetylase [Podila clonocystis]|nr:chitin deacetylase [Podila clonocystis]
MLYTPRTRTSSPRTLSTLLYLLAFTSSTLCLVDATLDPSNYPPPGQTPPVDSPEVRQWLSELDLSNAPSINTNSGDPPECPAAIPEGVCYWTCEDCSADDVVECPDRNVWGITFDDGPTPATPELLRFLDEKRVKATFFLVGGNVVQYPDLVVQESVAGHHLASHTWSHHALTTLTNEEIVAEMRWTEKAIFEASGYRVRYMRPPYGDVDNRVRFVLKKMGYTIVDWTGDRFDSNDWQIPQMSARQVMFTFKRAIASYAATLLETKGFITLEHDLTKETVAIAMAAIPIGLASNLTITTVADCLGDRHPYANVVNLPTTVSPVASVNATASTTGESGQETKGHARVQSNQGVLLTSRWSKAVLSGVIVETRWAKKVIFEATGLGVNHAGPPSGDVDNRVRFVLKNLGYTAVEWTDDRFILVAIVDQWTYDTSAILQDGYMKANGAANEPVVFPPFGKVPLVDSPQVRQWLSEIDLSGAPSIVPNVAQPGNPPVCPTKVLEGVCDWVCGSCSADDVVECPVKNEWAPTFDNGPTEATKQLLEELDDLRVKATFFLVGGNVARYPEIVKKQAKARHHLGSHSWSHTAFTTLTNEQIVAEIRWTEKAILDATGCLVKYFRPPYGDMDNQPGSVKSQISKFKSGIKEYTKGQTRTSGFITVESDENVDQVTVAKVALAVGLQSGLHLKTIASCLKDERPYAN